MQMFVLDEDPSLSARFLTDAHVRVICREVTMLLSTWYWYNVPESRAELPYQPMNQNQPLSLQMTSYPVRRWAIKNARDIFNEFEFRFDKTHASEAKYVQLLNAIDKYDLNVKKGTPRMEFTFVPKGRGVYPGNSIEEAVLLYRSYFRQKLREMRVPVVFTRRSQPFWLHRF